MISFNASALWLLALGLAFMAAGVVAGLGTVATARGGRPLGWQRFFLLERPGSRRRRANDAALRSGRGSRGAPARWRAGWVLNGVVATAGCTAFGTSGLVGAVTGFDEGAGTALSSWWSTGHVHGLTAFLGFTTAVTFGVVAAATWPFPWARERLYRTPSEGLIGWRTISLSSLVIAVLAASFALSEFHFGTVDLKVARAIQTDDATHFGDLAFVTADGAEVLVPDRAIEAVPPGGGPFTYRCFRHRLPVVGGLLGRCQPLDDS